MQVIEKVPLMVSIQGIEEPALKAQLLRVLDYLNRGLGPSIVGYYLTLATEPYTHLERLTILPWDQTAPQNSTPSFKVGHTTEYWKRQLLTAEKDRAKFVKFAEIFGKLILLALHADPDPTGAVRPNESTHKEFQQILRQQSEKNTETLVANSLDALSSILTPALKNGSITEYQRVVCSPKFDFQLELLFSHAFNRTLVITSTPQNPSQEPRHLRISIKERSGKVQLNTTGVNSLVTNGFNVDMIRGMNLIKRFLDQEFDLEAKAVSFSIERTTDGKAAEPENELVKTA